MPDRKLTYNVDVKDDASAVTAKIAKNAQRDFKAVGDAAADAKSAAGRYADAIRAAADVAETEMQGQQRAAERLGQALGSELSDDAKRGVDAVVAQLRIAGVAFDDIEANAEDLADAMKRMDDVSAGASGGVARSFDDTSAAAGRTRDEVDKTRSVVANFAGNAAQDLPGVSGAFGALNVAVGQFAEYASEGGIAMKSFLAAAAPLAIATIAFKGFTDAQKQSAASAKLQADQIENVTEKLLDGATAADALTESFRDAGKVEISFGDFGTADITASLAGLGVTVEDFTALVQSGEDGINTWKDAMVASGADAQTVGVIAQAAANQIDVLDQAQRGASVTASVLGRDHADLRDQFEHTTDAVEAEGNAFWQAAAAIDAHASAIRSAHDASLSALEADAAWQASLDELTTSIHDNGASLDANTEEGRANIDAATGASDALVDLISTRLKETGSAEDATEAGLLYVEALKNTLRQSGLTEDQVNSYIDTLNLTPSDVTTMVDAAGIEAEGQLVDDYRARLEKLPPNRQTEIQALLDEHSFAEAARRLDELDDPRRVRITADVEIGSSALPTIGAHAAGGPVRAGEVALVGERGPEIVQFGASGNVIPNNKLGGVGGASVNIGEIHVHGVQDERSFLDMLWRLYRKGYQLP